MPKLPPLIPESPSEEEAKPRPAATKKPREKDELPRGRIYKDFD